MFTDFTVIYIATLVIGFLMACAVGANDVANAMGTSVGAKVMTVKQAIIVAAIFEAVGAFFVSGKVTQTLQHDIVDVALFHSTPELLVYGMLSALTASAIWLMVATYYGWPVSTTHSIIGALIGFTAMGMGIHHIHWHVIVNIVFSWVITPFIAGALAYILFRSVQWLVLSQEDPYLAAKKVIPGYIFIVAGVIFTVALDQVGQTFWQMGAWTQGLLTCLLSGLATVVGIWLLRLFQPEHDLAYKNAERMFGILSIFTACAMAFAHGSNDVANAIGPMAAIIHLIHGHMQIKAIYQPIDLWLLALGSVGVMVGLAVYGYKVIETVGTQITLLTPSRGFSAQLATAATVICCSTLGLPVSTTQTLVGAVLGVGIAGGVGAIDLVVVRNIFLSWLITLPAGALLAIIFFYLFVAIF
jgi:inorganic phosphate transporter, PiT family